MIRPESEADLADAIAAAQGPLRIIGGGTRDIGRPVQGAGLSVARLSGITLYEPGALTLVARAGTPLAVVEAALAAEGQRLAFEPMDHRALLGTTGAPTLGGMVAVNASGPRRVQAGACRDSLIGVRFVDGRGTVIRNGGRVMKNVTGYDLARLMAGSFGTLGVLTELSFKTLPVPEAAVCLLIRGLDNIRAVQALSVALGSPFEVTGAAHLPDGASGAPETLIRIEGFHDAVAARAERLRRLLADFGPAEVIDDATQVARIWTNIRDVTAFATRPGDVWRISAKPGDGPGVAAAIGADRVILDWGGGLVWALVAPGRDIRPALVGIGGHATLIRADKAARNRLAVFPPEPAPVAALAAGLRRQFDPRGILNAGLTGDMPPAPLPV